MTNKDEKLSLEEVEEILEKQIASGAVLCSCPVCDQYLSNNEYCLRYCNNCNKEIVFQDILYYPGAKKENN